MELRQNYLPGCKRSQVLVILENWRRGTQVVRERSAKPLRVGSIPTRASRKILNVCAGIWQVHNKSRLKWTRLPASGLSCILPYFAQRIYLNQSEDRRRAYPTST